MKNPQNIIIKISVIFLLVFFIFSYTSASESATIWTTDVYGNLKIDFAPGEIVYIHGSYFLGNHNVDISVTRPDGTIETGSALTDDSGKFVYDYQLDGIEGTYTVDATDGTNMASTTFTDAQFTFEQWADKTPAHWRNGNLHSGNSAYHECEAVPFHLIISNPGTSDINITIKYDAKRSDKNGYDYLVNYDRDRSPTIPSGIPNTTPIPYDYGIPFSHDSGVFTLYNGTIISVSEVQNTSSGPSDDTYEKYYDLTLSPDGSNSDMVLLWGGHLASEADWGSGMGVSSVSGAPVHMRVDKDRSINPEAVLPPLIGEIIGYKWNDTNGDGFKDPGENLLSGWNITITGPVNSSQLTNLTGYYHFTGLYNGTYNISEILQDGWVQTHPPSGYYTFDIICSGGSCSNVTDKNFGNKKAECFTDDDCDHLDDDYCDGNVRKHDEGICVNYECEVNTTVVEDCNTYDGCYPYGDGCEDRNYFCTDTDGTICDYTYSNRSTDSYDDWIYFCSDDTVRKHRLFHDFYCNGFCNDHTSWVDDQLVQDCDDSDGWYDTGNTRWVDIDQCNEKEQKEQKYRDYYCSDTPSVDCYYTNTSTQWVDTGNTRYKPDGTSCDDGLYCTDPDTCTSGVCGGSPRNCSHLDDQCNDGVCNEDLDRCEYDPFTTSTSCDNGLYCDGPDHCDASNAGGLIPAVCVNLGPPINCSYLDGQCQEGKCDEVNDECIPDYTNYPLSTSCDVDNDVCTIDHCDGSGSCVYLQDLNCSDDNECTQDLCDSVTGCYNPPEPYGTLCGLARDCPDDICMGYFAYFYPDDGHDYCDGSSNCIVYSCDLEDSYCTDDDPFDGINYLTCGAPCDEDEDCPQTTTMCNYTDRTYCTRDSYGTCDGTCECVEDDWICGEPDDEAYCLNCAHCGDGVLNCDEECDKTLPSDKRCLPEGTTVYYCINQTSYETPQYDTCKDTCVWDDCETKNVTVNDTRCYEIIQPPTCSGLDALFNPLCRRNFGSYLYRPTSTTVTTVRPTTTVRFSFNYTRPSFSFPSFDFSSFFNR